MIPKYPQNDFPDNRSQGYSSKTIYDKCYNDESIERSVGPLLYKLSPHAINNCNSCLSTFGPRASGGTSNGVMGYGVSTSTGRNVTAPAQQLVDVDSILSNRNLITSRCKDGDLNPINPGMLKLQHARVCNDFLDPISTHLTMPPYLHREIAINRFYNLHTFPQEPIYWNIARNTSLETKDNYVIRLPKLMKYDPSLPVEQV